MIPDGIYRVYQLRHDEAGETHRRLTARLLIQDGQLQHLEDHAKVDKLFPEGPVTPLIEQRFHQMEHSGYHELVSEANVAKGHHPDEVQDLDVGAVEPEHRFIMTGDGVAAPALVEMWDDVITIDGRQLDHDEAHAMLGEVSSGRLVLTPLD